MKKLLLIILFVLVFVTSVFAQTGLWKYPSNYDDPDNQWLNEELIGDGYLDTAGTVMVTENKTWSSFIELIRNVPNCGAVRFYAHWKGLTGINLIDIDLYYNDMWNDLYEGVFGDQIWEKKSIGTVEFVIKARVRFYAKKADTAYLYAFQFYDPIYYVTLGASRIADASRVDQSGVDDGDVIQGTPWDISTFALGAKSFEVTQDTAPEQVFFKPDGLKMYVFGYTNKTVYQYSLSVAWDPGMAVYDNKSFTITEDPYPFGLFFKPDGTEMYVTGQSNDSVFQYSLTTAWDVSVASFSKSFSVASQVASPSGVFFNPDGLKMYVSNAYSTLPGVYQYSLTTAWDITSASYQTKKLDTIDQTTSPYTPVFKLDGLKLYVMGYGDDTIFQYSLSVAWDIDTATYSDKSYVVTSQETKPYGLYVKSDGLELFIVGMDFDKVRQYVMKTAWNKTNDFILATRIYGSKGPYARSYKLRWRISGGTFADVSDTGAITYSAVTDLTDDGDLLIEEKLCDVQSAYTWQNGLESEGDNLLPDGGTYSLADEYYTELQWALSCDDAEDEYEYEFELWDVTEPLSIGTCLASLTIAITAAGWPHMWSNQIISKWNTKEFTKWNGLE